MENVQFSQLKFAVHSKPVGQFQPECSHCTVEVLIQGTLAEINDFSKTIGIAEIRVPVHIDCDTDPLVGAHGPVDALEVFTWLVLLALDLVTPVVVDVVLPAVPAHSHTT